MITNGQEMLSNKPYLEISKDELNFSEQIGRGNYD